jgi:hypothetical protein
MRIALLAAVADIRPTCMMNATMNPVTYRSVVSPKPAAFKNRLIPGKASSMITIAPRQDERVKYLLARLPQHAVDQVVKGLRIDLDPPDHGQAFDQACPTPLL